MGFSYLASCPVGWSWTCCPWELGLRRFRLSPERRMGWRVGVTEIPAFAGKTDGMGRGLRRFRLSPERRMGWGGGYVDSGFRRKDGWDGEMGYGDTGFRRKDDSWAKATVGLPPNSGMTTDCRVVELTLRQVLSRGAAFGGWDDTILPAPRRPAAPWSPRSGVPPVARRWAGLPGCCRRERKGLANRSDRTGRCR